jgi:Fe-S-cluster containining protein
MTYDCQTCGACCFGLDVLLGDGEAEHFERTAHLAPLTVMHHCAPGLVLRFMKKHAESERCVALEGGVGKCRCTIYEERPALCRELAAGSPDCVTARRVQGREG